MSQRFVRCAQCGLPHDHQLKICPSTGLAISARADKPSRSSREQAPATPVAPMPPDASRRELIGQVLGGKYRVLALLGEGGMGAVFEAEHIAIGRRVALKVLQPKHARNPDAASRLQHEARVVGTLGHPNICGIYDVANLEDGSPYLVMERLQGETFARRIARLGRIPPAQVIDVALQVLAALSATHERNIIHRDLKPENIFLTERPGGPMIAKLLDFGISKATDLEDTALSLTRTGMVMGTPYYMAPEQARGDRGLDRRVDLWAVGVILYEALTGRRPFVARNYNALLMQILTTRHRGVTELLPSVPVALAGIVDKSLSKMREDRFQSARDLQAALVATKREFARPSHRTEPRTTGRSLPEVTLIYEENVIGRVGQAPLTVRMSERGKGLDIEDADATIVDPPSFADDSVTLVKRRTPGKS